LPSAPLKQIEGLSEKKRGFLVNPSPQGAKMKQKFRLGKVAAEQVLKDIRRQTRLRPQR
jgi:hypothetical protein